MKTVGLVVAKENSNRFKGKNKHIYQGYPLFYHSVKILKEILDTVYVGTDSDDIADYCDSKGIPVIWRGPNVSNDDEPLFSVLKYCYKYIPTKYDVLVNLLANSIHHEKQNIEKAIDILIKNDLNEVRSYDENGVENGLLVVNTRIFTKGEISTYVGMVTSEAKEIHYKNDF